MENENNIIEQQKIDNSAVVHSVNGLSTPFVVVPERYKVQVLEELFLNPLRIDKKISFTTAESFVAYVSKFKSAATMICADEKNFTVSACIDYHTPDQPSKCTHNVFYKCTTSRQWNEWIAWNKKEMDQFQFAEFIEDHLPDVMQPTGAELLEIATQFQSIRKAVFSSGIRMKNGTYQFQFSESEEQGTIVVPDTIVIGIPAFHGGDSHRLEARLRYKISGEGKLTFTYKLINPEDHVEDVFKNVVESIASQFTENNTYQI